VVFFLDLHMRQQTIRRLHIQYLDHGQFREQDDDVI
jgi:hypothetical protein